MDGADDNAGDEDGDEKEGGRDKDDGDDERRGRGGDATQDVDRALDFADVGLDNDFANRFSNRLLSASFVNEEDRYFKATLLDAKCCDDSYQLLAISNKPRIQRSPNSIMTPKRIMAYRRHKIITHSITRGAVNIHSWHSDDERSVVIFSIDRETTHAAENRGNVHHKKKTATRETLSGCAYVESICVNLITDAQ